MRFNITRPDRNVGREDRLIRAVVAGCLLTMAAYGLVFHGITLVALLFLTSGAYCVWSAWTARCFMYQRFALDTRSEAEAAADQERAAAQIDLRDAARTADQPADQQWGHSALGR